MMEWAAFGVLSLHGAKLSHAVRGLHRDKDRYNQWGGSVGGPIWKTKSLPSSHMKDKARPTQRPHPVI